MELKAAPQAQKNNVQELLKRDKEPNNVVTPQK